MIINKFLKPSNRIEKYFSIIVMLLLVEGIFRKWILPESIGNIFMLIRDPFVAFIVIKYHSAIKNNILIKFMLFMAAILFVTTMWVGHHNLFVALYGIRIWGLYFPAMYIFAKYLSRDYIIRLGFFFVKILPFIVVLSIMQFVSPMNSFVNKGMNADVDFTKSAGEIMFRPSGIFTSIAGLSDYYTIVLPFILYFFAFNKGIIRRNCLLLIIGFYMVSIPVSISRTHFLFTMVNMIFFLGVAGRQRFNRILLLCVFVVISLFVMQKIPMTQVFIDTFITRFEGANETEGGAANSAVQRTLGDAIGLLENDIPTFGYGEGFCTNFGVKLLTGTVGASNIRNTKLQQVYLDSEMEWARILTEDGFVFGVIMIIVRLIIGFSFFKKAYMLKRNGYKIPWLFLGPPLIFITTMPMKQPFNICFMFVYGSIFLSLTQKRNLSI